MTSAETIGLSSASVLSESCERAPLRILHVASGDLWAGAEAMLQTLAEAQKRLGGIRVTTVLLNDGQLAEELRRSGVEVIILSERSLNPIQLLARLIMIMRRVKPNVVHTHRLKEDILAGMANVLAEHACCVRTVHGIDEGSSTRSQFTGKLLAWLHSVCVRNLFDATFVVSAELQKALSERFPGLSIKFIANGINAEKLRAQARSFSSPEKRYPFCAGLIGRLAPIKRADLFLRVAALLEKSHPGAVRFVIHGDGPERAKLESLKSSLELDGVVEFAGFTAEIAPALSSLDFLLVTSDSEGLPMVVLEAMALNVPVIAHAVGQIPDVLENGLCGSLVTEQQPQAYAAVAAQFISCSDDFVLRAARAAERLATCFSADACARKYLAAYLGLLEHRRVSQ
jgi:glycosyltransferase involved in cell wall biosynthesis